MALRQVRRETERAARDRLRRTRRDVAASGNGIGGSRCPGGYRSAELAAARELGLQYEWDAEARVRRYRDRTGTEIFTATRRIISMVQHDEAAETAALRIAAAKWGGAVTIGGSSEFRERMAREAVRQGIAVEDADLASIVEDERERMARGEPPGGAGRERQGAQDHAQDEVDVEQDLGR